METPPLDRPGAKLFGTGPGLSGISVPKTPVG